MRSATRNGAERNLLQMYGFIHVPETYEETWRGKELEEIDFYSLLC